VSPTQLDQLGLDFFRGGVFSVVLGDRGQNSPGPP